MATSVRFLNPNSMSRPRGYSQVVEATGPGRIVYVAGQLGLDVGGKMAGQAGDFRTQAIQTFENLKAALAEVGATFNDVVKLNNYLTDLSYMPIFREVRDTYINTATPPASTTIQISALAREGAFLETEAIAILPARAERKTSASKKTVAKKTAPKKRAAPKKKKRR